MFTVKHISIDGSENLISAETVRYDPGISATGTTPEMGGRPTALYIDDAPYGGGTFFVMNANGKTVARYDLGASPVPNIIGVNDDPHFSREYQPNVADAAASNPAAGLPKTIAA